MRECICEVAPSLAPHRKKPAMRATRAANLTILLAIASSVLLLYGFIWRYASVPPAQIPHSNFISNTFLIMGVFTLAGSLWLSGAAFGAAPRRSLFSLFLFAVPLLGLWYLDASVP
jgi:di/tricarboxylate transporter